VDNVITELDDLADVTLIVPSAGDALVYTGTVWTNQEPAFIPKNFIQLDDVPSSYTGAAGLFLRVNSTEDGIEFTTASFLDLSDTPSVFGSPGDVVIVNGTGDGLIFTSPSLLIVEPNTQVVYGTGTSIDSAPTFTYDATTGGLDVNTTFAAVAAPGGITLIAAPGTLANDGGDVYIQGGNSVTGGGGDIVLAVGIGGTVGVIQLAADWTMQIGEDLQVSGDPGTSGYLFRSDGAGAPPVWANTTSAPFTFTGGLTVGPGNLLLTGGATISGGVPYDIGGMSVGEPEASAIILNYVSTRTITMQDDFAGSFAEAQVAATALTTFDIQRNGLSIGSLAFAALATSGTFTTTGGGTETFVPGDVLTVVAPVTPDATLADIALTFFGTV
jgi:hypothetical protein